MAGTNLYKTFSSSTNNKTCTLSVWVKRSGLNDRQAIASQTVDGSNETFIWFDTNDELFLKESGEATYEKRTNRKFRDTSAWYHIVMAIDTTQSTASDRVKLYINGVQETSWANSTDPALNDDTRWNSTTQFNIGRMNYGSEYFNGSMSHLHWIDGTAYDASAFGSTDSTTGEWKINTSPSVTYGTNGFFILKDGNNLSGATVADQSGNSNNFQVGNGTLTKTEDCPSNVFATGNPLMVKIGTWSNGNNSIVGSSSNGVRPQMWSTLGAKTGKFYAEAKYTDKSGGMVGVSDYSGTMEMIRGGWYQGYASNSVGFWNSGQKYIANATTSYGNAWSNNDIIQIAMDLDNMCVYFGINGTWQNSGNPASGASKTGGITIPNTRNEDYFMSWGDGSVSQSATCHVNYGNGYFGTTAVSSAGTNASGIGIFEYDVPTGYTALSTKGLNL